MIETFFYVSQTLFSIQFPTRSYSLRKFSAPTAVLEIERFDEAHAGEYRCIAENTYGERSVQTFVVTKDSGHALMPPTIRVEPKELVVVEGATIVLNASITGAEPVLASVRLYGPQQLDNVRVNNGERTIEIRGVLIFELRDEDHGASKNKV